MKKNYKPVALFILDGWGIRENAEGNAVVLANTPNYDKWNRHTGALGFGCVWRGSGVAGWADGQF